MKTAGELKDLSCRKHPALAQLIKKLILERNFGKESR